MLLVVTLVVVARRWTANSIMQLTTGMSLLLAIFSVAREHPHPTIADSQELISLEMFTALLLLHCCKQISKSLCQAIINNTATRQGWLH